ncbi:hypothetical protein EBZ37_11790 [bacterium]|nr:hypothetical protein [bacterium]
MSVPDPTGQQGSPQQELSTLFKDFLFPTIPPPSLLELIRAAGNEKIRVRELMPLFERNPALWHFLMKVTFLANKVKDWRAEVPETIDNSDVVIDRILGLLGKDIIRNLMACVTMNRVLGANLPRKNKDTSLNINPPDQLPFAILAQEYCLERKLMHADMAFNSGIHYDWMNTLLNKRKASQDQKALIKECFDEGFLIARVAYRVAQNMRKMRFDRYVFGAGLLLPIGKIGMGVLFPKELKEKSWAQLLADCEKHPKGKFEALCFYESRKMPITHLEISGLMASFGETLRPVERAITFIETPYFLDSLDPGLASLSGVLSLARSAALTPGGKFAPTPFQESFMSKSNLTLSLVKKVAAEALEEKVG